LRLNDEERVQLGRIASELVEAGSVAALCAYGSKVAGYSRPDSDYDLIVVSKRFREGVRYRYLDSPVPASALIVDDELLRQDARSSYLGEFVVGRLLNVYEPISGEDLLRSVEQEFKTRVVIEALLELSSDYGDFCRQFLIPYEYFLFDKLNRRAAVYPPALYSYVQTYAGPRAAENKAASVSGFAAAARSLELRGFLVAEADGVRLLPEKMKADAFTKVQSLFSDTTRGVTQYAIHGYAGRVGLSVFRREALSKLKRMRENLPSPPALERPRSLLKLEQGAMIASSSLLVKELAHLLGFESYSTREKVIGEPYSTTRVVTFHSADRESSVVVKNYTDVRSLKWALLGIWASTANKFSMAPLARMDREYGMTIKLRGMGIGIPSILAVAPDERILVKEFISGPTLANVIDALLKDEVGGVEKVAAYAEVMAKIHGAGVALGDAKASNVIISGNTLYLTDLEQAVPGGDKAWDIAEFIFYTAKLSNKEPAMRKIAAAFLDSYVKSGDRSYVAKARGSKYFGPFRPFLTPGMSRMLRDQLSSYV
jgi:tRNA A-37 threonylcarbamoyl transferase component Bud32/predicted nucleotidyltransferase